MKIIISLSNKMHVIESHMMGYMNITGKTLDETIDQAVENIKRLGHTGKVIVKTDNEPALLSLRDGVLQRLELHQRLVFRLRPRRGSFLRYLLQHYLDLERPLYSGCVAPADLRHWRVHL